MAIVWDSSLSVGVELLDTQHQYWISLINDLHAAMYAGKGRSVVRGTLQEVVRYTQTHFRDEERLLQSTRYLLFQRHKDMHDAFVTELKKLQASLDSGTLAVPVFVANSLSTWFLQHIRHADQHYAGHLALQGT